MILLLLYLLQCIEVGVIVFHNIQIAMGPSNHKNTWLRISSLPVLSPPLSSVGSVGSLLGVAGGAAGAVSYYLYDGKDMAPFRSFCLAAAAVSCLGFWWTGTRLDVGRLDTFKREAREAWGCVWGEGWCLEG